MVHHTISPRWIVILLAVALFVPFVSGLGVSPPSDEIIFQPNTVKTLKVDILGEGGEFTVKLSVAGELAEYIKLSAEKITVPPEGTSFEYSLEFPEFMRPGRHKGEIVIVTHQDITETGPGPGRAAFTVLAAVGYAVHVVVPLEGTYAEAKLFVPDTEHGLIVDFSTTVTNYGTEEIRRAEGTISIFDPEGKQVLDIDTDAAEHIQPGQSVRLIAHWTPKNVRPGLYRARVVVSYDGKTTAYETQFRVGEVFIDVLDAYPTEFERGKINKFAVKVASFWSNPLNNIYLVIDILHDGQQIERITTPPFNLEAWKEGEITAFWDTTNYDPGTYDARITAHFSDKATTKSFTFVLNDPPLHIAPYAITSAIFLVILAMNIIVVVHLMRKKGGMLNDGSV